MKLELQSLTELENRQYEITLHVAAADFSAALEQAYQDGRGEITVPGYEKGQADRAAIEKELGADCFYGPAAQRCCQDALAQLAAERGLDLAGYPCVTACESDGQGLHFTAVCDRYPQVRLGQYRGLRAEETPVQVTEEEVTALLSSLAAQAAKETPLDRPAHAGDTVHIDLDGTMDGRPFPGGSAEDYALTLGSHTLLPGLEDGICGMQAGETKAIPVTFPADYTKELAGKQAVFQVKVLSVCRLDAPAVDDDFAREQFGMDSLTALREEAAAGLREDKQAAGRAQRTEALLRQAAENMECRIPDSMTEQEADRIILELETRLKAQGGTLAQYQANMGVTEAQFRQMAQESALVRLRRELLFNAIRQEENLTVTDEDRRRGNQQLCRQYDVTEELLLQSLSREELEQQYLQLKTLALIVGEAEASLCPNEKNH